MDNDNIERVPDLISEKAFQLSPAPMAVSEFETGRFIRVNDAYCHATGLKREQILGKTAKEMGAFDNLEPREVLIKALREKGAHRFEVVIKKDSSIMRYGGVSACVIEEGESQLILTVLDDITHHKSMEQEIELSHAQFQMLYDTIDEGVALHRLIYEDGQPTDYLVVDVNPKFEKLLHIKREDVVGKKGSIAYQSDPAPYLNDYARVAVTGVPFRFETYFAPMDKHFRISAAPWGKDGFSTIFSDITEQVNNTKALEFSREKMAHYSGLMRYIIEYNRISVAVFDKDLKYMYVSQLYLDKFNLDDMNVIGRHHYEVFPSLPQYLKDVHQRSMNGEVISCDEDCYAQDSGAVDWVCWECRPWYESDGSIGGIVIYTEFINERKQMQQVILNEKEQFRTTLLSVGDGVIATDNHGRVTVINPVAEALTGWTDEQAKGRPLEQVFSIVNELTRKTCENPVKRALESGCTVALANHTMLIARDGREIPIEDSAAPIKDKNGDVTGVVLVFRDFTEKREKQRQVEFLSFHDQLTGLYNRRFYEEELLRLDTVENLPLSIVMLDVNGLKLINDAFGHKAGDALLKRVSRVMLNECLDGETVSRIGGDEFIILLPKKDETAALSLIDRIKASVSEEYIQGLQISVSIGVSTKYDAAKKMEEVLKLSEDQLYRDKIFDRNSQRYEAIQMIMRTLHETIPRERQHACRVSEICGMIGKAMGLHPNELSALITAAELHDIGKIAISNEILDKPGKLSDSEWQHPEVGYNILCSANAYAPLADVVLAHHERWDGRGYPNGLKGSEIPLHARIITVADSYDAMTEDRPYRKALSREQAIDQLLSCSGVQFDGDIVNCFINQVLSCE
jgi:diguanylate cyclase (GGDEF)-like protein/PAS domain S-box-containing protein